MAPSSSGLGHEIFILKTGVRFPVGSPLVRISVGFMRKLAEIFDQGIQVL